MAGRQILPEDDRDDDDDDASSGLARLPRAEAAVLAESAAIAR